MLNRVIDAPAQSHIRSTGALLCLLLAFLASAYYWSPLIEAKWSMADDHDIFTFIGQRERLPVAEIPTVMVRQTEIGAMGADQRFRPSYYTLHLLQASVFGKSSAAWYALRIMIAMVFSLTLAIVGLRIASPAVVFGFLSYELSRSYWADIFARLGDGETYAALGVAVCAAGVMLGSRTKFTGGVCASVAIGSAIAAGSKENFVVLAVVPLWIVIVRASKVTVAGRLWLMGSVLYSFAVASIVLVGVYNVGHDYYYRPVSLGNTLRLVMQVFQQIEVWVWITGCVLLWRLIRVDERKGRLTSAASQTLYKYVIAAVVLLLVYVSQVIFYSGQDVINGGGRYLFPQLLARDVSILIAAVVSARLAAHRLGDRSSAAVSFATAACFVVAASGSWNHNRLAAQQRVAESREFTDKIQGGVAFLKGHPDAALILNSHSAWDIEPVWSVMEYMRAFGVSNAIAVRTNSDRTYSLQDDPNPLIPVLLAQLKDIQVNGRVGRFAPLEATSHSGECYSYGLTGLPAAQCERGETIWPPGTFLEQFSYDGDILSFTSGGNGGKYLAGGWSQAEDWGTWSDGSVAVVALRDPALASKRDVELVIEARGFVNEGQPEQRVRVRINEADAGELLLGWDITSSSVQVPVEALKSSLLQVELIPGNPISPATTGSSSDKRLLGVGLKSLQLREEMSHRVLAP